MALQLGTERDAGIPAAVRVAVYIYNDHDPTRRRLVDLVEMTSDLAVVGSSGDLSRALSDAVIANPRVVVAEGARMSGGSLGACRHFVAALPAVPVVLLSTGVATSWGVADAAEAGASALIVKELRNFPLAETIRRLSSGERLLGNKGEADYIPTAGPIATRFPTPGPWSLFDPTGSA